MSGGMVSSTFRSALGQLAGLVLGALAVKILAITAGPSGVGVFSLFRHLQQSLSLIAAIGGQAAVVQGLSSRAGRQQELFQLQVYAAFLLAAVVIVIIIFCASPFISYWIFDSDQVSLVRWLTLSVLAGSGLFLARGILNAHLKFTEIAWINASTGLGGALLAFPAGYLYIHGSVGALVVLASAGPVAGFLLGWFFVRRHKLGGVFSFSLSLIRVVCCFEFLRLALPTLLSAFFTMGSLLIVRACIVAQEGMSGGGVFDAAWSISALYLALFLTSLQSYLLPVLARHSPGEELRGSLERAFRFALIASVPMIACLVLFKAFFILLLFSDQFIPALEILRWMLLGDCVKVFGWVMASALMARADMRGFMLAEFMWSFVFLMLSTLLLDQGLEWVGVAYFMAYIVYALFLVWRLHVAHSLLVPLRVFSQWLAGFLLICLVSFTVWDAIVFRWYCIFSVVPILFFLFFILRAEEKRFFLNLFRVLINSCAKKLTGHG